MFDALEQYKHQSSKHSHREKEKLQNQMTNWEPLNHQVPRNRLGGGLELLINDVALLVSVFIAGVKPEAFLASIRAVASSAAFFAAASASFLAAASSIAFFTTATSSAFLAAASSAVFFTTTSLAAATSAAFLATAATADAMATLTNAQDPPSPKPPVPDTSIAFFVVAFGSN
jgi:hypothetical protein